MDSNCCINCFSIEEIRQFIIDTGETGDCDYCGTENTHICNVEGVSEFVLEGFHSYYEDAAEHVGYESAEGGYQLPTSDIHEILNEEEMIFSEYLDDPTDLLNDIAPWDGTQYVRKDPYGPSTGDPDEIYYWSKYCQHVKSDKRFTLFLHKDENEYNYDDPGIFLKYIASEFFPQLITFLPKDSLIYRARIKSEDKKYTHKTLTSPPIYRSVNNRMSPSGISFFYGAEDADTCIQEIRPSVSDSVVVGKFKVLKNLLVLDLSLKLEDSLSIFHPNFYFDNEVRFKPFLRHFISDIAKPIRASEQAIEYIPTQVFTEFIRSINFKDSWLLPGDDGKPEDVFISGMKFKSSLNNKGINIVLFKGPEISIAKDNNSDPVLLKYISKKEYMITKVTVASNPVRKNK